jgi:hypothetical protein
VLLRPRRSYVAGVVLFGAVFGAAIFVGNRVVGVAFCLVCTLVGANLYITKYKLANSRLQRSAFLALFPRSDLNLLRLRKVSIRRYLGGHILSLEDAEGHRAQFGSMMWTGWTDLIREVKRRTTERVMATDETLDILNRWSPGP